MKIFILTRDLTNVAVVKKDSTRSPICPATYRLVSTEDPSHHANLSGTQKLNWVKVQRKCRYLVMFLRSQILTIQL